VNPDVVVKEQSRPPRGFYAAEAAGLRWLSTAQSDGGARVVLPIEPVDDDSPRIVVPRITTRAANAAAAEDFGRRLARTHHAGADWHGCPPDGWTGDGFIGPIPLSYNRFEPHLGWGEFFARYRIIPYAEQAVARGSLSPRGAALIRSLCDRLVDGDAALCGPAEPPSRLHGDLWSGNVLWDGEGAVLIDPAAHGGHRESDLAMLALFGLPHLDRMIDSYQETHPLADGWRRRVELHQLFPVLVHAVLFGPGYGRQATEIAARYG
jgi:fructosamine-3-kinase